MTQQFWACSNGAVELQGQYTPTEAGNSPNESSGWGRVHMGRTVVVPEAGKARAVSFDPPINPDAEEVPTPSRKDVKVTADTTAGFLDEGSALDTFDHASFTVPIPPGYSTLKVTLVWTDPAGEALQNDLDLIVVAPNRQAERHGNMGTREFPFKEKAARDEVEAVTPPDGHAREPFDRSNNVEQVVWEALSDGDATVIVRAHNVTTAGQMFAVAWRLF